MWILNFSLDSLCDCQIMPNPFYFIFLSFKCKYSSGKQNDVKQSINQSLLDAFNAFFD